MNICVFGSSSTNLDEKYLHLAHRIGEEIALRGHTLVFGGYDMGMMGAVAAGVGEKNGGVLGVTVGLLSEKPARITSEACTEIIEANDLSSRKKTMILRSDAFITLPGGIGTLDELFCVMAIIKAGLGKRPVAIADIEGYYTPIEQMLDSMCDKGLNSTDWHEHCQFFNFDDEDAAMESMFAYIESGD